MGSNRRGGGLIAAALAASVGMFALVGGPTADAATVLTFSPLPLRMATALQGSVCASPNECVRVDYSPALGVSVQNITTAIADATAAAPGSGGDGKVIVFGLSGGAGAAAEWMKYHAHRADAPSADVLSFVVIGNPGRKYGGYSRRFAPTPETQYQFLDIARQYDPIADRPDNPFNLLAQLNVSAGLLSPVHTNYSEVDINDPKNIRWTEGNTTYILVPTENLPLLNPLRALGLNALADSLNGPLKEIIERAYKRPVPVPAPVETPVALTQPVAELQVDPTVVSHPNEAAAMPADEESADRIEPASSTRSQSNSIAEPAESTVASSAEADDTELPSPSSAISADSTEDLSESQLDSSSEPADMDGSSSLGVDDSSAAPTADADHETSPSDSAEATETRQSSSERGNSDTSTDSGDE